MIIQSLAALALSAVQQGNVPASPGLTLESFKQRQEARMMAADSDGDGRISLAEYEAAAKPGHGDAAKRFAKFDLNHDGYLEKTEIDAMLARRFRHLDRDGNGILTPAERHPAKATGIVAPRVSE